MTKAGALAIVWSPRIAGLVMSGFLALFALDAFDGRPLSVTLPGFAIHLIPACLVLAAVAIAWRFPLAGAVAFTLLALAYAITVRWRIGWIAVIGAPLVVIAALLVVSWRHRTAFARPPA
jgi:hypothetical protein